MEYRQGDVGIQKISKLPEGAKKLEPNKEGKVILALGEATGHHHRFEGGGVALYEKDNEKYLEVNDNSASLRHEEHDAFKVEPGFYRVIQQREYSPQEIRRVTD